MVFSIVECDVEHCTLERDGFLSNVIGAHPGCTQEVDVVQDSRDFLAREVPKRAQAVSIRTHSGWGR